MLCPGSLLGYPKIPSWQVKVLGVPPGVKTMIPLTSGPKTSEHWVTSAPPPCPCSKGPPWQVKREGDPDDGASDPVKTMTPVTSGPNNSEHGKTNAPSSCAKAGTAEATIAAAMTNATVTTKSMRLISATSFCSRQPIGGCSYRPLKRAAMNW